MAIDVKKSLSRFKSDKMYRSKVGLYYGAVLNLAFVALQLYGGIRYRSAWFTSLAVYYAALGGVKVFLAHSIEKKGKAGWTVFQIAGFVMAVLNLALVVMISFLIAEPAIALHEYSLVIAITTAIWTLASAIVTIVSLIKMRGKTTPVALAIKLVQMVSSVVSILMLQTSMIASISTPQINSITGAIEEFGSVTKAPDWVAEWLAGTFRTLATTNNITGMLVAIFAVTVTLYMIIRGTKEGKRFRK